MTEHGAPDRSPMRIWQRTAGGKGRVASADLLQRIDQFVADARAACSPEDVLAALRCQIQSLGFEYFTYEMTIPPSGPRRPLFITTYPPLWTERYRQQRFASHDVVISYAAETIRPFLWEEVGRIYHLTDSQRQVFVEAREVGLRTGGLVPLHGPGPAKAYLCVANDMPESAFSALFDHHRHELRLLAAYTHESVLRLEAGNARSPAASRLTAREKEVLTWMARGKTRQDVSDILSLSAETIKDHLRHACTKLGAINKTHATAIAVTNGLIHP